MEIQWPLVIFTLLTGMGGWMLACIALNMFIKKSSRDAFVAAIIALCLVIIGGFASVLHLSHPQRIMNALSHPTSGIFVEAALVGIIALCAVIALICMKRQKDSAAKAFMVLAGGFGIAISFSAGQSYTVMTSHAAWDSVLLPLAYLGTAASMGTSAWWALCCTQNQESSRFGALLCAIASALGAALVIAYCALIGSFASSEFALSITAIACELVATGIGALCTSKKQINATACAWVTVVLSIASGLCLRVLMWVAGSGAYGFFGQ